MVYTDCRDEGCHLFVYHVIRLQILICRKEFPRSQWLKKFRGTNRVPPTVIQRDKYTIADLFRRNFEEPIPVPPLCTSCYPATNPDLRERISKESMVCIRIYMVCTDSRDERVPPLCISCYPATNPDLSERISTEPMASGRIQTIACNNCLCHLFVYHVIRLQILICRKEFPRSQWLPVPPLCTSCYPATNPDLRERISKESMVCIRIYMVCTDSRDESCHLFGYHVTRLQILICGKEF
ncbi:hypothetical protein V1477_018948 [Vespula maculifrons]|uniref:Uncharacterized protein n=1 Tax=Vespula maculifrons TaxID=7453 RepID=A0ABD2ASZ6_VESMC